jgi:hypothetical protein
MRSTTTALARRRSPSLRMARAAVPAPSLSAISSPFSSWRERVAWRPSAGSNSTGSLSPGIETA